MNLWLSPLETIKGDELRPKTKVINPMIENVSNHAEVKSLGDFNRLRS